MQKYFENLQTLFEQNANPAHAQEMKAYMRNKFDFLGIAAPLRRNLLKEFYKNHKIEQKDLLNFVNLLWQSPNREFHYTAIEVLEKHEKFWNEKSIFFFEKMISQHSWWDSVDTIATHLVGKYFQGFPEQVAPITEGWIQSENIWLQRTCLIFQLSYKKNTNQGLLFAYCQELSGSKEFFLQKAIGWALRQYSRTNPDAVIAFVADQKLSALSKKEALRLINLA